MRMGWVADKTMEETDRSGTITTRTDTKGEKKKRKKNKSPFIWTAQAAEAHTR